MYDVILCPACVSNRYVNCAMCVGSGKRPNTNINALWRPTRQFAERLATGLKGILAMLYARTLGI